jgi:hypothetical protein
MYSSGNKLGVSGLTRSKPGWGVLRGVFLVFIFVFFVFVICVFVVFVSVFSVVTCKSLLLNESGGILTFTFQKKELVATVAVFIAPIIGAGSSGRFLLGRDLLVS